MYVYYPNNYRAQENCFIRHAFGVREETEQWYNENDELHNLVGLDRYNCTFTYTRRLLPQGSYF